jgi:hypothetical protein
MNRSLISGPGAADPRTGVRRTDLWIIGCEGSGAYGDNARGDAYESSYVSDDGYGAAVIAVFPTLEAWGWDVCEMTTAGKAVYINHGNAIDVQLEIRPDDQADISYEYPHALVIGSFDEAQAIAKRLGSQDYSYALNLRRQ